MQLQRSLSLFFGIFLFIIVQTAAFFSVHNVKDPVVRNGCPCRKESGPDWITGERRRWTEQAVLFASLWVWFATSRGHHLFTDVFFSPLLWSLLLDLRNPLWKLKEGWTFTFYHSQQATLTHITTTWMDQPHQHIVLCFISNNGNCISSHQQIPLRIRSLSWTNSPKSHQCYSLCWASWKHFLK